MQKVLHVRWENIILNLSVYYVIIRKVSIQQNQKHIIVRRQIQRLSNLIQQIILNYILDIGDQTSEVIIYQNVRKKLIIVKEVGRLEMNLVKKDLLELYAKNVIYIILEDLDNILKIRIINVKSALDLLEIFCFHSSQIQQPLSLYIQQSLVQIVSLRVLNYSNKLLNIIKQSSAVIQINLRHLLK
ncbi:unnamed protein product [Paramecium pentaurelia]|uniref:Uncharacterized protein n=1 Tax=Paramecium pentaurelia TaxID=43138 RepID=A0A8S1TQ34_9CILI|nr:unnamed protein product [Paramecium pentaurelia]